MSLIIRLYRTLFVRNRALTAVSIIFVVSLVCAFATGFWLLFRLAYLAAAAVPVAYVWARLNLRGLEVSVEQMTDRLTEGQYAEERVSVRSRSLLSKLWLEVEDPSDMPGQPPRRVVFLGPRGYRSWKTSTLCPRRGVYTLGPLTVTSGDPFGLFRFSRTFGGRRRLLVYPQAVELPGFYVPPAVLPGEGRFRRRTHYVTPNAAGVRQYQYGDSLSRIHWPTTVRTNELMVKLFELDPSSDIWVVLDLQWRVQAGSGDDGTEEYGVKIAASIARYFLTANRTVGYMAAGAHVDVEEPERGVQQDTRILEALALARATGDVPLANLLDVEGRRFGRHTTVVVVTPSTDESWVLSLQSLAQRGVKVAAVLLEPSTFGADASALFVFGALAAGDIYTYLVKRSDSLAAALGSGTETPEAQVGGVVLP
jgi:uncharacterized protein (DUF58 family)